jgi:hypothetical protein
MRNRGAAAFCGVVLLCLSCSDSTPPQPQESDFELRIRITDSEGVPLPGMRVQGWSKAPAWVAAIAGYEQRLASSAPDTVGPFPGSASIAPPSPNPFTSHTRFRFMLPATCSACLQLRGLEGAPLDTLLDGLAPAGASVVVWDGSPCLEASGIYQARFDVWTPARDTLLFQDSVWVARYAPDPPDSIGLLGFTDEDGVVTFNDRLFFPGTYAHDPIEVINEEGIAYGFFTFSDTLVISVVDTVSDAHQIFEEVMTPLANDFTEEWQPLRR